MSGPTRAPGRDFGMTAPLPFKAIVFDFDGVILESVAIKTEAMAALFAEHPEHEAAIIALNEAQGGLSRFIKFDMIHRDILKTPLSPSRRDELGRRFSELVVEKVLAAPFVPGAREFLAAHHRETPLYVVSGTPDAELAMILARRRLSGYFRGAYGSDRQKDELLRRVLADLACPARDIVFVGDAPTDYQAEEKTGVPFIGRVPQSRRSPFPKSTTIVTDLTLLERSLRSFQPTN